MHLWLRFLLAIDREHRQYPTVLRFLDQWCRGALRAMHLWLLFLLEISREHRQYPSVFCQYLPALA